MNRIPGTLARFGLLNTLKVEGGSGSGAGFRSLHLAQGQGLCQSMGPSKIRVEKGQEVKWCACGMSSKQPFCDGSHKKEGNKTPITFKALETKEYFFCTCKKSGNKPLCDGTHLK